MTVMGYFAMLLVGLVLGLLGGGGAILTMPILVYLFAVSPVLATSYSLFIVGCASLVGVWRYHLQGLVDYKTATIFLLPSFMGTHAARRMLLPSIPNEVAHFANFTLGKDQLVMTVFAIIMVSASGSMIRAQRSKPQLIENAKSAILKLMALGFVVGFVAGFVGAGGGFLIIPALVVVGGIAMSTAVATSLFIISANSLVGFAGDLLGQVEIDWSLLVTATAVSTVGLFAGVRLSRSFSPGTLKVGFGWFVLVMGAWILARQIF
jgi:uncharacterized membrane protein YfcA